MARTSVTDKSAFAQFRRNWTSRLRAAKVDRRNRKHYGPDAPLFAERLWIPLQDEIKTLKHWSSRATGQVVTDWPVDKIHPAQAALPIKCCLQHWRDGLTWEQTGIYDEMLHAIEKHGKVDRLRTREDIERRYRELDRLYLQVKRAGGLSPRSELVAGNFREEGGVLFHIGPGGEPFFAGKGHHRLAIALALDHAFLPAQIGCIHAGGLQGLPALRIQPQGGKISPEPLR